MTSPEGTRLLLVPAFAISADAVQGKTLVAAVVEMNVGMAEGSSPGEDGT